MCTVPNTTSPVQTLRLWQKPAIESLFANLDEMKTVWPLSLVAHPVFTSQVAEQAALVRTFQSVMNMNVRGKSLVAVDQYGRDLPGLAALYHKLSDYLDSGFAQQQLVLYLPFELTTPVDTNRASPELRCTSKRFQRAYRTAFETLLLQHDVRANFTDGNVLEVELRGQQDHERVVKAAHLIPGLIQSGHLQFADVIDYLQETDDELLQQNILAVCRVLIDLDLVKEPDLLKLAKVSNTVQSDVLALLRAVRSPMPASKQPLSVAEILAELTSNLSQIENINPPHSTPNRTVWLRKQATENAIAYAAELIGTRLVSQPAALNKSAVTTLSPHSQRACIDGIRQACLKRQSVWSVKIQELVATIERTAHHTAVRDTLTKLFLHLHAKGMLSTHAMSKRGIRIPKLTGPFSENLQFFTPSVPEVESLITRLQQDRFLATRVYPAALLFGSQLKGYGIGDADADVAVFIRPQVSRKDEAGLRKCLRNIFSHPRIGGSVLLFWLDENANGLFIRENTQTTNAPSLPTWTHVLWCSAWAGDEATAVWLRKQLLTPHFYDPAMDIDGWPARVRWYEELARDALLYRLLHKGFERFYPIESPFATANGSAIDGSSAFYDPRFRRIATELYLTRVFLPNLGRLPDQK